VLLASNMFSNSWIAVNAGMNAGGNRVLLFLFSNFSEGR
jgi:hypothetical protein